MRRYRQEGYRPDQQLRALRRELLELESRIDEAVDDKLLEALLYERLALYSRMGAVIDQAKRGCVTILEESDLL